LNSSLQERCQGEVGEGDCAVPTMAMPPRSTAKQARRRRRFGPDMGSAEVGVVLGGSMVIIVRNGS
jgi:hypothetical protein